MSNYKYRRGQIVYYMDAVYDKIRTMRINHRMNDFPNEWEGYHCTCIDPKTAWQGEYNDECGINIFGRSVCEISQGHLFESLQDCVKNGNRRKKLKAILSKA